MLVTNISSTIVTRHRYFSLSWCDIISTAVMWHTLHYRDVTYFHCHDVTYFFFSLPWCDISTAVMWHTFHYRDVTYFQLPGCDILSTTLMWHNLHCRDVTYFPLAWCDILSLPWCDILSTTGMWHTVTRPRVSVHELYTEIQRTTGVHVSLVAWNTICNWLRKSVHLWSY